MGAFSHRDKIHHQRFNPQICILSPSLQQLYSNLAISIRKIIPPAVIAYLTLIES